jgi:hypothetical protein
MRFIVGFICFHTYWWTKGLVECAEQVDVGQILAIDNNPKAGDIILDKYMGRSAAFSDRSYNQFCDAERSLLEDLLVVTNPYREPMHHGHAMNFMRQWCVENDYQIMVHIEPDCSFTGTIWLQNLVRAIEEGYWMAGSEKMTSGILKPCCSAWNTEHEWDFSGGLPRIYDAEYQKVFPNHIREFGPTVDTNFAHKQIQKSWDTAQHAWFECEKAGKAKTVTAPDFTHHEGGSWCKVHPSHPLVPHL